MEKLKKQIQEAVDFFKSGKISKAQQLSKKLIITNPKVPFLYNLLGLISVKLEKIDIALKYYENGIKIDPNYPQIYNNIGILLFNYKYSGNVEKIENFYKKSISLNQNLPETHNNLGSLYESINKFDKALDCFKRAITADNKFFHAYHNLGNIYTSMGNFDEAKRYLHKSIKINPYYTNSHRTLSRLIKYTNSEKHFDILKNLYKDENINNIDDKVNISFALGKAYEDIKDYDKSFFHYKNANQLHVKKDNFLIKNEIKKFERIKKTFNKEIYNKYVDCGNPEDSSIFILGMPRSGTTLVEQILSSHPKVFGADEQIIISNILKKNFGNNDLRLFFSGVIDFDKSNFKEMGDDYIEQMKDISKNSEITTDKMTENFLCIGFIKLILPKSKIIHCYRNSKDNCLSIFKNHFPGGKIRYSYDLNQIIKYYNLYYDLMNYWNNLFPNFIFNIKYEDLITKPENQIRNLLRFCDLNWDDKCLNFHNNKRIIKTASDVQARNKIYMSSVNSWKRYEKYLKSYFKELNI